ncbi:Glycogen debranching enzyme [Lamellibrachia satsuma]|nr:Glycogen debranching enzyme [Lamellibrachia satsuma]
MVQCTGSVQYVVAPSPIEEVLLEAHVVQRIGSVHNVVASGLIEEVLMEAHVVQRTGSVQYSRDPRYLNGLPNHTLKMRENIKIDESKMVKLKATSTSETSDLDFANFNPGSIICFKVTLDGKQKSAILNVRQLLSQFGYRMRTYSGRNLQEIMSTDLERITTSLSLNDLNRVLYHVGCEESDDGFGFGAYNVPGYGDLPYCGLQGIISVLRKIRKSNDLGHPLCANLRTGDWLLDYVTNRLKVHAGTKQLGMWFETAFSNLRRAPRYLIPCYFDAIISGVYTIVEEVAWASMSDFVQQGSSFERSLAMGSIQFVSFVKTARLPELSPNLEPPRPKTEILNEGVPQEITLSLAAGLPHFASGIWRNWGRDTFISFRGLLLITGRYSDARFLILAFASTLRHGLIPNLLGGGTHARYNCRDAVWWWLQCIQEYCMMVEGGNKILTDTVSRIFPTDDSTPHPPGDKVSCIHPLLLPAQQP